MKKERKLIPCACGCGELIMNFDKKGRERKFLNGHQNKNRVKSEEQAKKARLLLEKHRPSVPWNKGKSYTFACKDVYATKGAWMTALKRTYQDKCMICGWDAAPCDCHHIIPKKDGGENSLENGSILCPNCHRLVGRGTIKTDELIVAKEKTEKISDRLIPGVCKICGKPINAKGLCANHYAEAKRSGLL